MKHIIFAAIVILGLAAPALAHGGWSLSVSPGGVYLAPPPPPPPPVYVYPPYAQGYYPAPAYPGGYYAAPPYYHRYRHRHWD